MAATPCVPSELFKAFLDQYVEKELSKSMRRSKETITRELWAAANYDNFQVEGTFRALVDALGSPLMSAAPYRALIMGALDRITHGVTLLGTRQDPVYARARDVVAGFEQAEVPGDAVMVLQSRLGVNFERASRLLEAMEGDVLTSPDSEGQRRRLA